MRLARLEVEGGFLNGLSLDFEQGLNVLIGPRGAGKTSVIELIRFCLDIDAYTTTNDRAARDHALSVLQGGQCVLTVEIDGALHRFARSAEDDANGLPTFSDPPPIVLSQNEIEKVGLDTGGRLRLVDDFIVHPDDERLEAGRLLADVASIAQELQSMTEQLARLDDEAMELGAIEEQLKVAEQEQEEVLAGFSELEPERQELAAVDADLLVLGTRKDLLAEARDALADWLENLAALRADAPDLLPDWATDAGAADGFAPARKNLEGLAERVASVEDEGSAMLRDLQAQLDSVAGQHASARKRGRTLRSKLDEVQAGAGEISRRITLLKERINGGETAKKRAAKLRLSVEKTQQTRHRLLADLDRIRSTRFEARKEVAGKLNNTLAPQVKVSVLRYGVLGPYIEAITSAMQGSRLRHKKLAPQIAERMTPAELAEAVEQGNVESIAETAKIAVDRAEKVIEALRASGTDGILRAEVEDSVEIGLLDGPDYKLTPRLSTGQRCTAVLPVLLSHTDRPLVIDQPEDHLDNAYVADTVVRALRDAPPDAQLVLSTHNANIPVLGEANLVTLLESDGQRGFVKTSAALDSPETVSAITRVMEGGEEAFQQRAQFYRDHDPR